MDTGPDVPSDLVERAAGGDVAAADPVAAASADLDRLIGEAAELEAQLSAGESSQALVPVGGSDPTVMKAQMADLRALALRKHDEIRAAQQRLSAELERRMAQARAALEPMSKLVARMSEGISAMNLYLGRDEQIVALRGGQPAPADTPIVVRQLVLSMDQECALDPLSGGIDVRDVTLFDEWLLADEAHVTQIIPEDKAIVALMPRVTKADYGDPWVNASMREQNTATHLLIRNGERLFRTSVGDFSVGARLVPTADEFTELFMERTVDPRTGAVEMVELQPGSRAWLAAEERSDARRRHYMKVALILQGLIDRTSVLAPLPAETVSLLSVESYDAGHVVIVADGEQLLGTGRPTFREWQLSLNEQLQPGMRVIGVFAGQAWSAVNERERGGHSRLSPPEASAPRSHVLHTLERRPGGGLMFRFERSDRRWGREHGDWGAWGEWPYQKRASCAVEPADGFMLAVDLASRADIEFYLRSRSNRHEYLSMFPVLHAALAVKDAEDAAEAPFRQLLAGHIAQAADVDVSAAEGEVAELVSWWKFANRHHRPLAGDPAAEAKAFRMIVAEWERRRATASVPAEVVAELRGRLADLLFVARRSDNTIVALTPEDDGNVFVAEHLFSGVKLRSKGVRRWRLSGARFTRLTPAWVSPRWEQWDHGASPHEHLTGPELDGLVDLVRDVVADPVAWVDVADRNEIFAWSLVGEVAWDADRPLSGDRSSFEVRRRTLVWRRGRTGELALSQRSRWDGGDSALSPGYWPWDDVEAFADASAGRRQVRQFRGREVRCVFVDTAEVARAAVQLERDREMRRVLDRLRGLAHSWCRALSDRWRTEQLEVARVRFVEDYGPDPDLWESQLARVKVEPMPSSSRHDQLRPLADALVERGVDLTMLSPGQALMVLAGFTDAPQIDAGRLDERVLELEPLYPHGD